MAKGDVLEVVTDISALTAPAEVVFGTTPSAGELLLFFASPAGGSLTVTGPTGSTEIWTSGTTWPRVAVFAKVASGSENSFTITTNSAGNHNLNCVSYRIEGTFSDTTGVTGVHRAVPSGTSVKIVADDQTVAANTLVFAAIGTYHSTNPTYVWNNSFANATTYAGTGVTTLGVARRAYTGAASDVTTTPSWTGSSDGNAGLVFVAYGSGGGGATASTKMAFYRMLRAA